MSSLEVLTGRKHMSHSSLSTWLDCGERFYLERVAGAPQSKAWYLIGGSAFHTATEWLDRGEMGDPTAAFLLAWNQQCEKELVGVDIATVRAGGKATKEWPNKEDQAWWLHHGPIMVAQYVAWRDARLAEGWQFFTLPDGSPAVEVPIQIELDGVLVKGYIDRVMVNDDGELLVDDLKTGSHTPASALQLGIYALGMERHFGVRPILGAYYMARKGELTAPTSLLHYTPELVGKWFKQAKFAIENDVFLPHVTSMCSSCSVRQFCSAFGGSFAKNPNVDTIVTSH